MLIGFFRLLAHRTPGAARAWGIGAGVLLVLLGMAPGHGSQAQAAGGLLVAPTRLVFEGRTRSAYITLVNKGTERATFRIALVERRMLENGQIEVAEEAQPGELSATDLIRYAPRRIVLEPKVPQTIRILVRKPRDLPAGEYRSHMRFLTIPDVSSEPPADGSNAPEGGISVRIRAVFGLTIPVIVRHGDIDADIAITDAEFQPAGENAAGPVAGPVLTVGFARSGAKSVFGDVRVTLLGEDGAEQTIGLYRGMAVYSPNRRRTVRIPIDPSFAPRLKGRQVKVDYLTPVRLGGQLLAENRFTIR